MGMHTDPLPTHYQHSIRLSEAVWRLIALKWQIMQTTDLILLVVLTQLVNQ